MNEYKELIAQRDTAFTKWHEVLERNSLVGSRSLTEQEIEDEFCAWREFNWLLEECRTYYIYGVRGWPSEDETETEDETEDGIGDKMYKLTPKAYEELCRAAIREAAEFEYYLKGKSIYSFYELENLGRLIAKIHPAYVAYRDSAIDSVTAIKSIDDMYDTGNALLAPAVAMTVNVIHRTYKEL